MATTSVLKVRDENIVVLGFVGVLFGGFCFFGCGCGCGLGDGWVVVVGWMDALVAVFVSDVAGPSEWWIEVRKG